MLVKSTEIHWRQVYTVLSNKIFNFYIIFWIFNPLKKKKKVTVNHKPWPPALGTLRSNTAVGNQQDHIFYLLHQNVKCFSPKKQNNWIIFLNTQHFFLHTKSILNLSQNNHLRTDVCIASKWSCYTPSLDHTIKCLFLNINLQRSEISPNSKQFAIVVRTGTWYYPVWLCSMKLGCDLSLPNNFSVLKLVLHLKHGRKFQTVAEHVNSSDLVLTWWHPSAMDD